MPLCNITSITNPTSSSVFDPGDGLTVSWTYNDLTLCVPWRVTWIRLYENGSYHSTLWTGSHLVAGPYGIYITLPSSGLTFGDVYTLKLKIAHIANPALNSIYTSGVFEIESNVDYDVSVNEAVAVDESHSKQEQTWKIVKNVSDAIEVEEDESKVKSAWKINKVKYDQIGLDEDFWSNQLHTISISDEIELDGDESKVKSEWKINRSVSDSTLLSESIIDIETEGRENEDIGLLLENRSIEKRKWRHVYNVSDTIDVDEDELWLGSTFKTWVSVSDSTWFSIDNIISYFFKENQPGDSSNIVEDFDYEERIWRNVKNKLDDALLNEDVDVDTRTWKHLVDPEFEFGGSRTLLNEDVDVKTREWKHLKSSLDWIEVTGDKVFYEKRTFIHHIEPDDNLTVYGAEQNVSWEKRTQQETYETGYFEEDFDYKKRAWKQTEDVDETIDIGVSTFNWSEREWKTHETVDETIDIGVSTFNWSVHEWQIFETPVDATFFAEVFASEVRTFIHVITPQDDIVVSPATTHEKRTPIIYGDLSLFEEGFDYEERTWKHLKYSPEVIAFDEEFGYVERAWKHLIAEPNAIAFEEEFDTETRVWKHLVTPEFGFGGSSTSLDEEFGYVERAWKHLIAEPENIGLQQNFSYDTRTWKHLVAVGEVLEFLEEFELNQDIYAEPVASTTAFIEEVLYSLSHNEPCSIMPFQDTPTELYGTQRRTGWIKASKSLSRAAILRRLNVEYHSADPIDVKIFADGDDVNEVYHHTLAAAISDETANESVRISRRAKNFMVELSSPSTANPDVMVENFSVEVDV